MGNAAQGLLRRLTGRFVRAAPRHAGSLAGARLPRSPAFSERDLSDKPFFVRRTHPLGVAADERIAARFQQRRESLLAVDDAVAAIVKALRRVRELRNTYVIFTSDNGFMQGEHGVAIGKLLPYDPSTRVPLIVRGPGLPAGRVSRALVGNVDLAPTIVDVAGATPGRVLDGESLVPFALHPRRLSRRPLLHETGGHRFVRARDQDASGGLTVEPVLGYRALRTDRWLYVEYRNGAKELYDLRRDPYELHSLHTAPRYRVLREFLRRHLQRLDDCRGAACRRPLRRAAAW